MAGGVFLKRTLKWYSSSFRNSEGMRTPRKSEFIRPVILTCSCIYPPAKSRWRGCTWIIFHPCELFTPPLYFKTFSALFSAELAFQQETFWELKKLTLADLSSSFMDITPINWNFHLWVLLGRELHLGCTWPKFGEKYQMEKYKC